MDYISTSRGIRDVDGDEITFAIGTDQKFYTVFRDPKTPDGWRRTALSAPFGDGFKARCFAATQNRQRQIFLAIAGKTGSGENSLYVSDAVPADTATWGDLSGRWTRRLLSHPEIEVAYITMGTDDDAPGIQPLIVVGTTEKAGKTAKFYRLDDKDGVAWFPEMQNADQVLDVRVGARLQGRGAYSLYRVGTEFVLGFTGIPDPEYQVTLSATFTVPPGAMELNPRYNESGYTDLYVNGNGRFLFTFDNQTALAHATKVTDDAKSFNPRLTVRSSLAEEYRKNAKTGALETYPVYRGIIRCPPDVTTMDIWAEHEVTIEAEGSTFTIDAVTPARVHPSRLNRVMLTLPATALACPAIRVRTNLMRFDQSYVVLLDSQLHQRIATLPDGALYANKDALGIHATYAKSDCDRVQKTLQSLTKTIQYTYNRTPHGVHHDRAVLPPNMDDTHFSLDFSRGGGVKYQPLTKAQVGSQIAGARLLSPQVGQGFFDEIAKAFENAEKVVVHTFEEIGHDVVDTAEHVGRDLVTMFNRAGEDLVRGDLLAFGGDLIQGGENLGMDLVSGALNVASDVVEGAGQLVMITLHLAGEAVQFILDHTGVVGKFIENLLQKIGAGLEKALDWLLDKIGWDDVLRTHDALVQHMTAALDQLQGQSAQWKATSDTFFQDLIDTVRTDIAATLTQLGTQTLVDQPAAPSALSFAVETVEWVLSKLFHQEPDIAIAGGGVLPGHGPAAIDDLLRTVETRLGKDGHVIFGSIDNGMSMLQSALSHPENSPALMLSAALELAQAFAIAALDALAAIADALFDLLVSTLEALKRILNTTIDVPILSDLYTHLTKGRQLTVASVIGLVVAVPATLICKAAGYPPPFQQENVVGAANEAQEEWERSQIRDWGFVYAACQLGMSVIDGISDVKNAVEARKMRGNPPAPGDKIQKDDVGLLLDCSSVTVGLLAQLSGNPVGSPITIYRRLSWENFQPADKDIVENAPTYWSHVIWYVQWPVWLLNGLAVAARRGAVGLKWTNAQVAILNEALAWANGAWGIAHMALMSVLDDADRAKYQKLKALKGKNWSDVDAKVLPEYKRYVAWADGDGIPLKGFGNIMGTFTEFAKVGASPKLTEATEGISVIVTAGVDAVGHLAEGITYVFRTKNEALL